MLVILKARFFGPEDLCNLAGSVVATPEYMGPPPRKHAAQDDNALGCS
jgi:hypothetical protein